MARRSKAEQKRIAAVKAVFQGKTIQSVDPRAVNQWDFVFTDGSKASVEVEAVFPNINLYGLALVEP